MIDCKGSQCEKEIILWGVRWYVAYPIFASEPKKLGPKEKPLVPGLHRQEDAPRTRLPGAPHP
jgi:hypothetical protein